MESGLAARNKKDLKRAIQFFEMALELANSEKMKNKIRVKIDDVKSSFLIVAEDEDEPGEEFEAVTKSYNTKTKQVAAVLGERHVNSWPLASVVNAANAPAKKMKHQGTQTPPRKKHKSDLDPPLPSEEIVAYRTEEAALALRQVDSTLATLPASGSEQEGDGKDELTSEDRKRLENQILDIFNTANEKKIKKLKTVGTKRAEDIANFVEDEGEIGDWKLLGDIPGLSKAVREKLVMVSVKLRIYTDCEIECLLFACVFGTGKPSSPLRLVFLSLYGPQIGIHVCGAFVSWDFRLFHLSLLLNTAL
jgi:DNA uptake protein ComE-like DNA-binding protein